ncbi:MAG: hypothetical protein ACE5FL_05520, partial [Myxococcota bacterium]
MLRPLREVNHGRWCKKSCMQVNSLNTKILFPMLLVALACAANRVDDRAGRATVYQDPGSVGPGAGVGIESQDIVRMTDEMMRDMLRTPVLAGRQNAPRIIVDSRYFDNQSSTRINVNTITDRLR